MLEVTQLTRKYDGFTAVDNVSFTINKGEIVGLLGHNGAGKTTIMKMISGYLEPDQGVVEIDGLKLANDTNKAQQLLGYLPENLPVYPEMTVADYLDYAAELKGLNGPNKQAEIRRVISATEITDKLLAPISTLSRGYKQRVGVAQAILGAPRLLILDEPTNGLDPEQVEHMRQLIRDIARDATVILSTHIMQEVNALCSRVLMLRAGRLAVDAKLEDLRRTHQLRIETTLPAAESHVLDSISGIHAIHQLTDNQPMENIHPYRIELEPDANERAIRAELAGALIQANHNLYLLQPEYRDLETLFREVNEENYQQEVLSNAV